MDYEKKYKDALEWARKVMQGKVGFVLDEVLEKFPELKESEGERIRKHFLYHFRNKTKKEWNGIPVKDILAWLEKQGEQKSLGFNIGDEITVNGQICKVVAVEQKPAWSKDDEINLGKAIWYVENPAPMVTKNAMLVEWLKNLRGRVQPQHKQEWTEEDEELIKWSINNLTELKDRFGEKYGKVGDCINWLKSLRDPRIKTYYWTENEIKFAISDYIRGAESYEKMVEKLRCLKPQNRWRPSDEQMKALNEAIYHVNDSIATQIAMLIGDLNKL